MRNATLKEQQIIQEHIDEISKLTMINFWDMFNDEDDEFNKKAICKHIECPYKNCNYHRYTDNKYTNISFFELENTPDYIPKTQEEMKYCMSYMDI